MRAADAVRQFGNGYSVRIFRKQAGDRIGGPAGSSAIVVYGPDGRRTYDTPLNDDVLEGLDQSALAAVLASIESWPARNVDRERGR